MKRIVGVTGGIGAGKSVVCHSLEALGFPVYDCDSEARRLMDADHAMQQRIACEVTPDAIAPDGRLDRCAISRTVFSDRAKLNILNSIVHGAVRDHFILWARSRRSETVFVETAILYESGFNELVTEIWEVTAPRDVRITRVERRNGLSRHEIEKRIASQQAASHPAHRIIINDDITPILPQILTLIEQHDCRRSI